MKYENVKKDFPGGFRGVQKHYTVITQTSPDILLCH